MKQPLTMKWDGPRARAAIIGGSEDGKTFLATGLVRGHWRRDKLRAIVFDPWLWENDWGKSAWVTNDFGKFRRAVGATTDCVVVWDEGTHNGGRDRENVDLFTAIRHNHPYLYFIGHGYSTMLPLMRGSLTDILLAARDDDDAAEWARVMVDKDVLRSALPASNGGLKQYEFLHKRKHQPCRVLKHTKAEILKGVTL